MLGCDLAWLGRYFFRSIKIELSCDTSPLIMVGYGKWGLECSRVEQL